MFEWTRKRIEWYERAIKWTGYDKALADAVKPYLDGGGSVCDLGCGTGYLALELARQGFKVSAVDMSREAIDFLRGSASSVSGLETIHNDWADIAGRQWDNVIMCQTGDFDAELPHYLGLCRKKLIVIGKSRTSRWLSGGHLTNDSKADELGKIFMAEGLCFIFEEFSAELGQPFISIGEAEEYLRCYGIRGEAYRRALEMIKPTGDALYPFYLPYKKEMGIWVININT
jgi:SAM-dependent methyltransferase